MSSSSDFTNICLALGAELEAVTDLVTDSDQRRALKTHAHCPYGAFQKHPSMVVRDFDAGRSTNWRWPGSRSGAARDTRPPCTGSIDRSRALCSWRETAHIHTRGGYALMYSLLLLLLCVSVPVPAGRRARQKRRGACRPRRRRGSCARPTSLPSLTHTDTHRHTHVAPRRTQGNTTKLSRRVQKVKVICSLSLSFSLSLTHTLTRTTPT